MEAIIKVKVQVLENEDNFKAALARIDDDNKLYPLINITDLTRADLFVKFGIKVPAKTVEKAEGFSEAERILTEALDKLRGRTIITTTEAQDVFLDALNIVKSIKDDEEV